MAEQDSFEMDRDVQDARLGSGGAGVISLSTDGDEPPYSVPVSYGFDADEQTFYFRLAVGAETHKGDLDDRPVSFVTYGQADDGWWSVVAKGSLESLDDADVATESLAGLERVTIPFVDIFGTPPRLVSFEFYRLVPEELTGRQESTTAV